MSSSSHHERSSNPQLHDDDEVSVCVYGLCDLHNVGAPNCSLEELHLSHGLSPVLRTELDVLGSVGNESVLVETLLNNAKPPPTRCNGRSQTT